jgi:hypothetical protein
LFCAVVEHGAYWFSPVSVGAYIADKVDIAPRDGDNLAEFFARLWSLLLPGEGEQ